jgi:Uma2 family endonuclease
MEPDLNQQPALIALSLHRVDSGPWTRAAVWLDRIPRPPHFLNNDLRRCIVINPERSCSQSGTGRLILLNFHHAIPNKIWRGGHLATQPISGKPAPDYGDDSRFERIDGLWVARPVPGSKHSQVQWNVTAVLKEHAKRNTGEAHQEWSVTQPETANLADPNYMTPDVLLACPPIQENRRGHLIPPGFLAVEVKSPEQEGLITKAQRYYAWGIEHVWIIDPDTRECLEYHGGDQYTLATEELHAEPISVKITDIFEGLKD